MRNHLTVMAFLMLSLVLQASMPETDSVPGEKDRYPKSALLSGQFGKVLHTHTFVRGENPRQEAYQKFMAFTAEFGIHTDGRKLWQQLYHYPVWGVGLFKGFLLNDYGELGNPLSVYAFFNAPFKRWKRWSLDYDVGFGVSFNWNKHDILENGYSYPIGTFSTIYFAFKLGANVQVSKHLNLHAGINYTHFSNGSVKLPNLGINLWAPQVSLQYIFNERPEFISREKPRYLKEWEWIVILAPAFRQVGFDYGDPNGDTLTVAFDYAIFTFSSSFNRQFTHLVKFGVGFDITYNEAYGAQLAVDENGNPVKGPSIPFGDQLLLGVYPSFELVINKFSMVVQSGFYVYRKDIPVLDVPKTYQRIGLKYHFADHYILGLNIRAYNFSKADFIEWVLGYRIKWQKSNR